MSNKNKNVKKFTGKHKLDKYLTKDEIKKLGTGVDLLLNIQNQLKNGKKKFMGGAIMKSRSGTFKGTF